MKKVFLLLVGALLCSALWAQGPHHVNVYLGGYNGEYLAARIDADASDLYNLYEPHYKYECGPTFTVEYTYSLLSWLQVGAQTNVGEVSVTPWRNLDGYKAEPKQTKVGVSLLPEAKLCIPSPRHFRLYGKVAAGMTVNFGQYTKWSPVQFAWDLVPIGCEWAGQRVYGTAELCYGSIIRGGRIGIGFRF